MNPGETLPRDTDDDAELGEALHHRLSQLAARLQRLTGNPETQSTAAGHSVSEAQRASDAFEPFEVQRDEYRSEPARAPEPVRPMPTRRPDPPARDSAAVQDIAEALRQLGREDAPRSDQIGTAGSNDTPAPHDARAAEQRLRAIRERIEALKTRHARPEGPQPGSTEHALRSEIAAKAHEGQAPAGPDNSPRRSRALDFNAAIEEIAARQKAIDEGLPTPGADRPKRGASRPPATAVPPGRSLPSADSDFVGLDRQMARIAGEQKSAGSVDPTGAGNKNNGPSGGSNGGDNEMPNAGDIRDLRHAIGVLQSSASLDALKVSHAAIELRLDEIARASTGDLGQISQQILQRMPSGEKIDRLSVELDRLSDRIAADDHGRQLGALRDAVEGLFRIMQESSSPGLARIEERLNHLSSRLESVLENAPRADSVATLLTRLEDVAAKGAETPDALRSLASEVAGLRQRDNAGMASLESQIQALASKLDEAVSGRAGASNENLEGRIESLTARLDELANAVPTDETRSELAQLEEQLARLSSKVEQLGADGEGGGNVQQLEQHVQSLTQRLDLMATDHDAIRKVQDNLSRLEGMVVESEVQATDNIQAAAREAVRELSGMGGADPEAIEALKADLRELQEAQGAERQTAASLDRMHDTLDRVVHRLEALEADVREEDAAPVAGSNASATPKSAAASQPARPATAPEQSKQPDQAAKPKQPAETVSRPIAPGANRGDARPAAVPMGDRDRRADFIAAARRAAQAAAAEHGAMRRNSVLEPEQTDDADSGPGPLARLGGAMSRHRRPLLIAAGAIVLAIAAFQIARPFLNSDDGATAPTPAPIEGEAPELSAATLAEPAIQTPANAGAVPASPAFMPPAGVVSPRADDIAGPLPAGAGELPAVAEDAPPIVEDGVYPLPPEEIGSVRLRVAAAEGDPPALYEVGARYADGNGVERDMEAAAVWFERAAENGVAVAQHRIATLYEAGLGVPQDRAIAYEWYTAAAEQGNVMAMHNLGVMLSQGIDGEPQLDEAIAWFSEAANHGIRDSQYNLGVIYARGIGIEQNLQTSYLWFALAAEQGDADAAARRDEVAATLTADQLAAARAAVSAWSAEGAPADANMVEVPEGGWDAEDARVSTEDREQLVRTIQNRLVELGYDPGPADGMAGPMTVEAVRAFQIGAGLEPTGQIDTRLLAALTG